MTAFWAVDKCGQKVEKGQNEKKGEVYQRHISFTRRCNTLDTWLMMKNSSDKIEQGQEGETAGAGEK